MADNNNPQDFADKVLQSLKKQSRAVDLTDNTNTENVVEQASVQPLSQDFTVLGSQIGGGLGPASGGNKDLVVVPGYGGTAATSTSQINFYWNAPAVPDSTGVDNNVRATIFNYATSVTNPVLVIGGYNGTSQFKPHPTYGGGTGVTAKILIDPFLGRIDVDQIGLNTGVGVSTDAGVLTYDSVQSRLRVGLSGIAKTVAFTDDIPVISGFATTARNIDLTSGANNASHFLTFSLTSTGSGVALSSDAELTYNPSTNILTATTFSGNLTGTATTAQNVNLAAGANASNHSVVFSLNSTGSGVALSSDAGLQYNPATNVLSADVFSGNVSGTAVTATNLFGTFNGSLVGTATTAQNTNVAVAATNASHFITFTVATSGSGLGQSADADLTYNPSTNVLSAGVFSGNFTGTAVTATNFFGPLTGNVTGNLTGTATTAQNINTTAATTAATHFVLFSPVNATASGVAVSSDAQLQFNPGTNVLTADVFSGNVSGTAVTATNFFGTLVGNSSTATTSANVNTVSATTNATHFVTFSPVNGASGVAISSDAQLTYNPSTDVLSATTFSGNVSGTAVSATTFFGALTGTATTAQNINTTTATTAGAHFLLFSPVNATASGVAVSSDSTLQFNPATNVLSTDVFSGNVSGTAVTATNIFGSLVGTATTAQNVNLAAGANNANHAVIFSLNSTGSGVALSSDAQLFYNPSTDTLFSTNFSGSFSGTITGIASSSRNVDLQAAATDAVHYITFSPLASSPSSNAGVALSSDAQMTWNPASNIFSIGTGYFAANGVSVGAASNTITTASGNLNLDSVGGQTNINDNLVITGNLTVQGTTITVDSTISTIVDPVIVVGSGVGGTHSTVDNNQDRGIEFRYASGGTAITGFFGFQDTDFKFKYIPNATLAGTNIYTGAVGTIVANIEGNVSGTAVTATNFFGTLVGNSSTATTSANLNTVSATTSASHFLLFSPVNGASGVAVSSDAQLTYNPATDVLSATTFSGSLTGTATTAQNVNLAAGSNNTNHAVVFSLNATGTGVGLSSDAQLTYNPSTDVLSATTFSGNVTGTAITATNFFGTFAGFAQTARATEVVSATTNATHFITFTVASSGSGLGQSADAELTYNPSTNVLSAGVFSGNFTGTAATATNFFGTFNGSLVGTATTAQNVNTVAATTNASHFITFSPVNGASGVAISSDANLTFNPSTNVLTADVFSGNVSGTAVTATNIFGTVTGNVTGNLTGTATTAQNTNVVAATTNATHFLTFTVASSGSGLGQSADADLTYNPSTNVLSASVFSGNLTGTAVTATNFFGALTGNVTGNLTGTATTAININTSTAATAGAHFLLFSPVNATASGVAVSSDSTLQFNPGTNVLSTDVFSGNVSGTAVTATNLFGTFNGNLVGTATTAQNTNIVAATTNAAHYITFTTATSGSGLGQSADADLAYNPSTNVLSAGVFSGNFTGTAVTATNFFGTFNGTSATATTAQNVNVVAAASAGAHFLLLAPAASGSGLAVSSDAQLSYVPTTDTLTVSNIFGSGAGLTLSASAALTNNSYLTIQTVAGDDASTSDFFIRGITSGASSKFSVDANGNLRATTKSFDIDHPTKPGKRLVYGVLEGPEHGVYHRGTVEGKGNLLVELPDYWNKLVNEDYTVTLTTHGNYSAHIVEKSLNSFIIGLTGPAFLKMFKPIKVDYLVHGSRKDAPLIIEQDDH